MRHLINKFRFLFLFIVLFVFFMFKAVNTQLGWSEPTGIVFAVIIASSLLIIGHKERLIIVSIAAIVLNMLLLQLLGLYLNQTSLTAIKLSVVILFFLLMLWGCLYFTAEDETISITTMFGSITSYLFIGLIFAYLYMLIEVLSPHSFSTLDKDNETQAIYFSFITLTTVGYGEITPLKPIAQTFVWFEAFCGQIYLAIIMGQLVGRYVAEHLKNKKGNSS